MKKYLLFFLISIITTNYAVSQTIIAQGTCGAQGDNLTWVLTSDSVLTISGVGEMMNYTHVRNTPWNSRRENINSVVIENGVTSIGSYAFFTLQNLTYVKIPNSITTIGKSAFELSGLLSVTIPNSVTTIRQSAFSHCSRLLSIDVDTNNLHFASENGVLFDKSKTTLIQYPVGRKDTTYAIPYGVTAIGDFSFAFARNLTSIIIPNSVTTIGIFAFQDCVGLTSVTIPHSVREIGHSAFLRCFNLTNVNIEYGVKIVGNSAFAYSGLTSVIIPESVTTIRNSAFAGCYNLASLIIGSNVTTIECFAFRDCRLRSVISYAPTPPTLGNTVFWGIRRSCRLQVPAKSVELYRRAQGWRVFRRIVAIEN